VLPARFFLLHGGEVRWEREIYIQIRFHNLTNPAISNYNVAEKQYRRHGGGAMGATAPQLKIRGSGASQIVCSDVI